VAKRANTNGDSNLYGLYDRLDRLEELLEDMAELGVTSRDDVERMIRELNEQIDSFEGAASDDTP
jgi:hypothetical protein